MHDIYYGTQLPPRRKPIPMITASDRIGEAYLKVDSSENHRHCRNQFARPQYRLHPA